MGTGFSRMPPFHAFRTSSSIAAEQPHRRTQNPRVNIQQPNLCVALTPFLYVHSQHIQPKRVTDPLNEGVRARLCGKLAVTDQSTHCSARGSDPDIDSERLADMIFGFGIVDQDYGSHQGSSSPNFTKDRQFDGEGSTCGHNFMPSQLLCDILQDVCSSTSTAFELCLLRNLEKAIAIDKGKATFNVREDAEQDKGKVTFNVREDAEQKSRCRLFVMNILRFAGYNAGICKSRWERTIGHPAGSYEFIDVVIEGTKLKNERFFVDIDFKAQFEIARPTASYNNMLQTLPTLFVGREDKLCWVVKIMCNAARRSLKEKEMYIPPWRKYCYMQNKWLASYKRTTNPAAVRAAENALFQFPYPSMELQATRSNAGVLVDQMEKGNVASQKNLTAKSKYTEQANERFKTRDLLWKIGDRERHVNRVSRLATALAEAGLTTMTPSKGT